MKNPVKAKLLNGEVSLGGWLNLASPLAAEVMAGCGFDWLTCDAEHSIYDLNTIASTFQAVEARGVVPFARVWDHDPVTMARVLDAGAYGIIIPHVSTPEDARMLADSMRYPPVGKRSTGTGRIAALGADYTATANAEVLVMPQLEDLEGIDNAEAILSLDGVDVLFIGPADLAMSMGVQPGHPDHEAAILKVAAAGKHVGKPVGLPIRTVEGVKQRIADGFQLIDCASDLRLLQAASTDLLRQLR